MSNIIISNTIFTFENDKYTCDCGSSLKRSSIYGHLKSKKHQSFLSSNPDTTKECTICMENDKQESLFWKCTTCNNDHCKDCHDSISRRNPTCPFCRTQFDPIIQRRQRRQRRPRQQSPVIHPSLLQQQSRHSMLSRSVDYVFQNYNMIDIAMQRLIDLGLSFSEIIDHILNNNIN